MRKPVLVVLATLLCSHSVFGAGVATTAAGQDAAAITPARDSFRSAIGGGTVAGPNGSFGGVRREINWDGVPDGSSSPNSLPPDFFNVNSPRGVIFSTPGTSLQVSANASNPTSTPVRFGNFDGSYPAQFTAFTAQRLFSPIGSNVMDVVFRVAGTAIPASVSAFGVVFTDVERANDTSLQFFDSTGASLGTFFAPASLNAGFSFLGVQFNAGERVARVRITSGSIAINAPGAPGGPLDAVVMDDFIYAEPALPVPVTLQSFEAE